MGGYLRISFWGELPDVTQLQIQSNEHRIRCRIRCHMLCCMRCCMQERTICRSKHTMSYTTRTNYVVRQTYDIVCTYEIVCYDVLSVLKSHFNSTHSFVLNSCIVFCVEFANEDSFAHSICKKDLASWRQSMMALGKRWFGFRRFKKCWRAFATRAKAHCLDQNWHSLAYKAQSSNH
jgi:hypothetical protein